MRPKKKLREELKRIEEWYHSIIFLLEEQNDSVIEMLILKNYKSIDKANISEVKLNKRETLKRYLNDSTLIRLISSYEIFLIGNIELYYKYNIKFLQHQKKFLEISYGELSTYSSLDEIWIELIQKECKAVRGLSYHRIKNYFKKKLNVLIAKDTNTPDKMEWFFDVRNIIVHRLGKTDSYFKKKYNYSDKYVNICKNDIEEIMNLMKNNSIWIEAQMKSKEKT